MLETLRRGLGFRIATALAFFAALCLVAPPAVLAFGHGPNTAHCLSHADVLNHGMGGSAAHAEHDGMHGDQAQLPSGKAPGCCGLFCLSALVPTEPDLAGLELPEVPAPCRQAHVSGGLPELPDRPPIPSLSV
jgi:hypothetical protein